LSEQTTENHEKGKADPEREREREREYLPNTKRYIVTFGT
jgi:hypothetical protein